MKVAHVEVDLKKQKKELSIEREKRKVAQRELKNARRREARLRANQTRLEEEVAAKNEELRTSSAHLSQLQHHATSVANWTANQLSAAAMREESVRMEAEWAWRSVNMAEGAVKAAHEDLAAALNDTDAARKDAAAARDVASVALLDADRARSNVDKERELADQARMDVDVARTDAAAAWSQVHSARMDTHAAVAESSDARRDADEMRQKMQAAEEAYTRQVADMARSSGSIIHVLAQLQVDTERWARYALDEAEGAALEERACAEAAIEEIETLAMEEVSAIEAHTRGVIEQAYTHLAAAARVDSIETERHEESRLFPLEERAQMAAQIRSLEKRNSTLRKRLQRLSSQQSSHEEVSPGTGGVLRLKEKGVISDTARALVRDLITLGVTVGSVQDVIEAVAKANGTAVEGGISTRSTGRIMGEAYLASKMQFVEEVRDASGELSIQHNHICITFTCSGQMSR